MQASQNYRDFHPIFSTKPYSHVHCSLTRLKRKWFTYLVRGTLYIAVSVAATHILTV